jgi:L-alanine-DL-glutamate epimerase-like enolase superfamily enzyme
MKIASVELYPLQMPQKKTTRWANGQVSVTEHIIVKVIAENGVYGVTEAIPRPGIYGETPASIYYALSKIVIPKLIGLDSFNFEAIWEQMNDLPYNYAAKGSIDVALHDLNGKLLNLPTSVMLGGPYRKAVPLSWVSGGTWFSEEMILEETKQKIAEGYKAFKVKAGHVDEDIKLLKKMRSIAPDDVKFLIDPNQLYSREDLTRVGYELTDVIDSIEEPIAVWDDEGRREFAERFPKIPLLSDESTFTYAATQRQMKLGAIGRLGVKIPRTGFTITRKLVHLAEINNMRVQVSTQAESNLGSAPCVQFAAAFKQIDLPCEIGYYAKDIQDSLLVNNLTIKGGKLLLPEGPGHGVEPDWEIIKRYTVAL